MVKFTDTLVAILAIHTQTSVPSKRVPLPPNKPIRDYTAEGERINATEPVTARETVISYTAEHGEDYFGLGPHDVVITAPQLADIVGYSEATARRRLDYFREQGVVQSSMEGNVKYWQLTDEFSALGDDTIRDEETVTATARKLLELADDT